MALTGWGFHPAARWETKQPGRLGQDRNRLETRCCRRCQTAARLGRRMGDRPSARCVPSHDRHCLMNITEAVPSCQSARLPADSGVSQSQQKSEVTSQYAPKKSAGQRVPVGQGQQGRRGRRGDWRSCLLNLYLTHTNPPTPRLPLVPQLPPVLSIRERNGKSRPVLVSSAGLELPARGAPPQGAGFNLRRGSVQLNNCTHSLTPTTLHQDNIVITSSRAAKCTRRVPNLPRPLNHVASETPPRQWQRHGQSHDSGTAPEHCPR